MSRSNAKSQQDKYVAFKTAFQTVNHYLDPDQENFLAAYVIAFSLIEDRVRAMYVVQHRSINGGMGPTPKQINASFANHVRLLQAADIIPQADSKLLLEEAKARNELLHAAMWNLNAFTRPSVEQVLHLARTVDKLRRAQKRLIGNTGSK